MGVAPQVPTRRASGWIGDDGSSARSTVVSLDVPVGRSRQAHSDYDYVQSWMCILDRRRPRQLPREAHRVRIETWCPATRWVEQVDGGGSSLAHLLLHVARHQDLAVTTAIRNHPPLFDEHRQRSGLADAPASAGLAEREDPRRHGGCPADRAARLLQRRVRRHRRLARPSRPMALDTVPATSHRLAAKAGLTTDEVCLAARHVGRQAGVVADAVAGDRPRQRPRRRSHLGAQPDGPQPVLTDRRNAPLRRGSGPTLSGPADRQHPQQVVPPAADARLDHVGGQRVRRAS